MSACLNLFANLPADFQTEISSVLAQGPHVRIERIVSNGQASPRDFWYDQNQDEFVVVLKGAARLRFDNGVVNMTPGSFLNIPAHQRHRVDWTTPDEPTIWLAIHYGG
jgi:cupin 2 domain-containing protein